MLRTIAHMIYAVDRLFPRVRVGGRESAEAYARWEYELGRGLLERYAERFGALAGKDVLDIGCGLGGKTVAYAEAGATVTGIDIEQSNIVHCIEFSREYECAAAFSVGDAESLPFRNGTFDLVVANDSMEHFARPEAALTELERVLRPGGLIFLFFTPWRSPLGSHLYDYIRTPWCNLLFSERVIEELLTVVLEKRGIPEPEQEAARLMSEYHTELNRITIFRYHNILAELAGLETEYEELKPARFALLKPLTRLPFLREYFTGTVFGVLRKKA
jgi:ubiquinone/menaquinone biosynthesis C-methylase UbiE